jgi:hypothetical protein
MPTVVLLGPQRYRPTLAEAFRQVNAEGPVAVVTAGWEEREDEIDDLTEHLGCEVVNLRLHARAEHIFDRDREFRQGWRARRERQRAARRTYRLRLQLLMDALRALYRLPDSEHVEEERADALRAVQELDERRIALLTEIHEEFKERWKPAERKTIALHRKRVEEMIGDCGAIAFAGGHVGVLRNRLRLFAISDLIGERPVFAWSAGAMCAKERIVAFHDSPPQGRRDAVVLDYGLGICPRVVALPHASRRLDLADRGRVMRFAKRLAPRICVALDDASGLIWDGNGWDLFGDGARRLRTSGDITEMQLLETSA